MRKLTPEQWEKKYVAGPINRFDSKYNMFSRTIWDPEIKGRLKNWGFIGEVKSKPGFMLQDQALRWSARRGTMMTRFKNGANPGPASFRPGETASTANPARPVETSFSSSGPLTYRPPEGARLDVSNPAGITRDIKKVATYFGADLVGICRLDKRWLYSTEEISDMFQSVMVLAFEEEYDLMQYSHSYIPDVAVSMGYSRMAVTNAHLAAYIENLGFKAIDSQNDIALSVPLAMQAGLGEVGRFGLLITPKYGPRVRLSKVITDLPLTPDSPIDFGVTEFCEKCKKCARLCPSHSISHGERTVQPNNISNNAGGLKWPINAETCRMYWAQANKPCTACVSCCPYNKPDTWPHRATLWFTDHLRIADSFYAKMDDFLGYGKPKKADRFWEEWRP